MSVGERIRYLRKSNGIKSQEELAYLVDTARQTISLWERDVCLPEGANLLKLAKVLNTSVAYIMGETPTPESSEPEAGAPRPGRGLSAALYHGKMFTCCPPQSFLPLCAAE